MYIHVYSIYYMNLGTCSILSTLFFFAATVLNICDAVGGGVRVQRPGHLRRTTNKIKKKHRTKEIGQIEKNACFYDEKVNEEGKELLPKSVFLERDQRRNLFISSLIRNRNPQRTSSESVVYSFSSRKTVKASSQEGGRGDLKVVEREAE